MDNNFNEFLRKIIEERMRTVFIAAIAAIEDEFGDEFGLFKSDDEELTEYEDKMNEKFEVVRKKILDVGNRELRNITDLVGNCNVELVKGYILMKGRKNENV